MSASESTSLQSPPPPAVAASARDLVAALRDRGRATGPLDGPVYHETLERLGTLRAAAPALPVLSSGHGEGARVVLADGRRVVDLVAGLGPYVFGHHDEDLLETAAIAAASDVAFQSHVLPGPQYLTLTERLVELAGPRLQHAWLALSGSMANENALKMLFQRSAPADRVIAFARAFHGRTLAMAELTDRPAYRDGLPTRDFVDRVPFYDPSDPDSTRKSVAALEALITAQPGGHAAMCFELIQGEGGFHDAPREFFVALMETCQRAGIRVWIDEIQTFGRTRDLFAFRTLGLDAFVDVVTVGKILQGSATLFTSDIAPRPKLIAGTWAGSTVGMALGARILERLASEGYSGAGGRIDRLAGWIDGAFARLDAALPGVITARSGAGAMQAFVPWEGDAKVTTELVEIAAEEGALVQTAGGDPMKIRLLPPLNLTEAELEDGFAALERALVRVARRHGLPIFDVAPSR
ncbi:MAG: aminotransferase class III-fold pyridoxal phosphate-dependent enzyme [bacterium]|nr:aminotransferase class III-fold pyridoxal phosphate-dependent enzyme [bacterium]